MKIDIIVSGRFHAFDLARQLEKKNLLNIIITTYPKYFVANYNIPKKKVRSFLIKELIYRLFIKLKLYKIAEKLLFYLNHLFENFAAKSIDYKNINLIIGWSGCSEKTFLKCKKTNGNILKVLERGSTHIKFQNQILLEEYKRFGIKSIPVNQRIIDKELREYDAADYIMVPSQFAKNSFLKNNINNKKILKVPYGVDLSIFKKSKTKPNGFNIVCAGQISFRKGSYYLIKAFTELKLKDSKLILVGDLQENLKIFIKPFLKNENIILKKHVPQNKLKDVYNISHLFVSSSIEEGMAMVQAQAMACGLPLICTTNSGGEEIVEENENGFVCPIRDTEYLKEKILSLYENRTKLNSFSEQAYEKSRKDLSWDKYGDNIVSIYNRLLNLK